MGLWLQIWTSQAKHVDIDADEPSECSLVAGEQRGPLPSPGSLPPVCRWGVPGAAHGTPGGLLCALAQLLPDPRQL